MGSCGHTDIFLETVRFQLPGLGACQTAPIVTQPIVPANHHQDEETIKAKVESKNGGRLFFFLILFYFLSVFNVLRKRTQHFHKDLHLSKIQEQPTERSKWKCRTLFYPTDRCKNFYFQHLNKAFKVTRSVPSQIAGLDIIDCWKQFCEISSEGVFYFLHASFTAPEWLWARASNHDSTIYDQTAGLNKRKPEVSLKRHTLQVTCCSRSAWAKRRRTSGVMTPA